MDDILKRLSRYILVDGFDIVVDTQKSQGSWLVDARTNKKYLDFFSHFSSQALGWNHPKILQAKEQLGEVALHKIANSDIYTEVLASFIEEFSLITPDFDHYFFIEGGALGVENALKAAFDYKSQKLNLTDKQSNKLDVIHFKEAFHGRSGYTLSLTNTTDDKTKWYPKFRWTRVMNPKITFPTSKEKIQSHESVAIHQIESAVAKNNVAAIVMEPIQGEGGDNYFRQEFFQKIKQISDEYDIMLIFDEVQTGMGTTGKWWAYEHYGITPDLLCFGKKSQVCGFCSTTKIDQVKNNVFKTSSRINSTWGGNIVDMLRASLYIRIIKEEHLVENAKKVGQHFLDKIEECSRKGWFKKPHHAISNIRGKGLMLAFDGQSQDERDILFNKLSENMLVLKSGTKSIRFRPHLTVSEEEIDYAIKLLKGAVG